MKPGIKSFGFCMRIIQCLVMLSLCFPLHAADNDLAELGKAAFDGKVERVRELLDKKPELLNGNGKDGTPLCAATILARKEVIELLLSKGADPDLPAHQHLPPKGTDDQMLKPMSVTPLHLAAYQGYTDVAKMLLAAKANPSAKSENGTTPLHTAAAYDRTDVVKVLIAAKADVNACDMDEATPLHYATSLKTLAVLVAGGSDMNIKAEKGEFADKTPLELRKNLVRLAALAPNWGKSDINIPENLAQEVRMLKYMTYALRSFSEKHGSYPSDLTAATLEKSFKDTVRLKGNTANDFSDNCFSPQTFPNPLVPA